MRMHARTKHFMIRSYQVQHPHAEGLRRGTVNRCGGKDHETSSDGPAPTLNRRSLRSTHSFSIPFAVQATNINGSQSPSSPRVRENCVADRMCRVADSIIHSWKFETKCAVRQILTKRSVFFIHTIRVLLHHSWLHVGCNHILFMCPTTLSTVWLTDETDARAHLWDAERSCSAFHCPSSSFFSLCEAGRSCSIFSWSSSFSFLLPPHHETSSFVASKLSLLF